MDKSEVNKKALRSSLNSNVIWYITVREGTQGGKLIARLFDSFDLALLLSVLQAHRKEINEVSQ